MRVLQRSLVFFSLSLLTGLAGCTELNPEVRLFQCRSDTDCLETFFCDIPPNEELGLCRATADRPAEVVMTTPRAFALSVSPAVEISVRFSHALAPYWSEDPERLASVFRVNSAVRGGITGRARVSEEGFVAHFKPERRLHAGEPITVAIRADLTFLDTTAGLKQPFSWQFTAQTTPKTSLSFQRHGIIAAEEATELLLGDLDGDGDLDTVTMGSLAVGGTRVWLNDGEGAFTSTAQSLSPRSCVGGALGDFNNDGALDIFLGSLSRSAHRVWHGQRSEPELFRDSGDSFGDSDASIFKALTGDFNGDGDLDIATNRYSLDGVYGLALNNEGSITLETGLPLLTGILEIGTLGAADVDGDGDLDILSSLPNELVLLNDGSAGFTRSGEVREDNEAASSFIIGDVDGDGDVDVGLTTVTGEGSALGDGALLLLNDGQGRFSEANQEIGDEYTQATSGDLNGDGHLDVVLGTVVGFKVWLGEGDGRFVEGAEVRTAERTRPLALGDLDDDGDLDLVLLAGDTMEIWLNE